MQEIFAGAFSVPVIDQALGILGNRFGAAVMNDEDLDAVPAHAIILAACAHTALFPSRFIRRLPELPLSDTDPEFESVMDARRNQCEQRQFKIPDQVLTIPRLVLIRRPSTRDGRYPNADVTSFTAALRDLAGIPSVRTHRNRGRNASSRRYAGSFGLQPYVVA